MALGCCGDNLCVETIDKIVKESFPRLIIAVIFARPVYEETLHMAPTLCNHAQGEYSEKDLSIGAQIKNYAAFSILGTLCSCLLYTSDADDE